MIYPTDLKDREWELIKGFFKRSDPRGFKGKHDKRQIVNAILYIVKTGAQWRMLPKDFPNWKTVHDHFRRWSQRGVWAEALEYLIKIRREKSGKNRDPSYGIIDSQSVKSQYDGESRGIDGGKKNQGT